MAKQSIRIQFSLSQAPDSVHRIRNFAEELYRKLSLSGMASVPNMDEAVDAVDVVVSSPRHLGGTMKAIRAALRHHNLEDAATIQKGQRTAKRAPASIT